MFVDLEESIYTQLRTRLKSYSSGSVSPPLYISLALLIGATITTPQEQFMIRIGPLEPSLAPTASSIPSIGVPFARLDLSGAEHYRNRGSERDPISHDSVSSPSRPADQQKRTSEEKAWERRLVQQIIGISTATDMGNHDDDGSCRPDSLSPSLPNRAKVHLLMKAPSGLVFQGMLPKQMIVLQEDYSLSEIETEKDKHLLVFSGTATATADRKRRWPIYHIHVLGPTPERRLASSEDDGGTNDHAVHELWYQVGSGIPVLSTLL